jgi:uncharacterized protein (TIGR02757 family)
MDANLARALRRCAERYETDDFIKNDPSQFMHLRSLVGGAKGREAAAFIASTLSFGSIPQFLPKIGTIVSGYAKGDVDGWVRSGGFRRDICCDPGRCFYRFVTCAHLRALLEAYHGLMHLHGTLGEYVKAKGDGTGLGAVKAICAAFRGSGAGYLVPADAKSACKRVCMFLRWMVRSGSPVDLGLWAGFIDRRTLIIPLDTHVLQQAAKLGLSAGRQSSMSAAIRLTASLAEVFPDDPLKGDFALFGQGLAESRRIGANSARAAD